MTRKTEVPGKGITGGKYGFGGELLLCHGNVQYWEIMKRVRPLVKGTSRGPEALQSHLNDSHHTNVLCWP